ncbi:MAG: hypothetical protein H6742_01580 [Alphaproteobacteria bacterium]|nr:hypothetical protein [Alphaproteobacteria bacterium]
MILPLIALLACSGGDAPSPTGGSLQVHVAGALPDDAVGLCADAGVVEQALGEVATRLAGAAVWVGGGTAPVHAGESQRPVEIAWDACGPHPAAVAAPAGSPVTLRNTGDFRLTLRWQGGTAELAPGGTRRLVVPESGRLDLQAPGREQSASVAPAAWGAVTDGDGIASLDGLPPGTVELHVLHPAVGARTVQVDVPPHERAVVEVDLR